MSSLRLKAAIRTLAEKTWTHPVTGRDVCFAAVTIERWYYTARREKDDPVGVLRRAVRKDCGQVSLPPALSERNEHRNRTLVCRPRRRQEECPVDYFTDSFRYVQRT